MSCHAICSGWVPSADSPSRVITCLLATVDTGVWQERTARPSRWTVHAPHRPAPQPNLVPFRLSTSRITQSNGMSAGTSTVADFPLTVKVKAILETPQLGRRVEQL